MTNMFVERYPLVQTLNVQLIPATVTHKFVPCSLASVKTIPDELLTSKVETLVNIQEGPILLPRAVKPFTLLSWKPTRNESGEHHFNPFDAIYSILVRLFGNRRTAVSAQANF